MMNSNCKIVLDTKPRQPISILKGFKLAGFSISDTSKVRPDTLIVIRTFPELTIDQKASLERGIAWHCGTCNLIYELWKPGE